MPLSLNRVLLLVAVIIFAVVAILDRNLLAAGLAFFAAAGLL